jgi:hypothetical protein
MTANQGPGVPDNEVLRALSAAMAALFGDAPDSWLFEAEDVVEHLQADGYRIVRADRLERLIAVAENVLTWNQRGYLSPEQLGLQFGDLDPLDPVAPGEGQS